MIGRVGTMQKPAHVRIPNVPPLIPPPPRGEFPVNTTELYIDPSPPVGPSIEGTGSLKYTVVVADPVPGPIARCRTAGPDPGEWWSARLVATAPENRLSRLRRCCVTYRRPQSVQCVPYLSSAVLAGPLGRCDPWGRLRLPAPLMSRMTSGG
jgi:hypothetical protein